MEKIVFRADKENPVEFFVLEQTTVSGINYILVTDKEEGDSEALILKDISKSEDEEALYEIVSDETELNALADIFASLMDDIAFE
ncbi:MAG: DUF1292 domain-containing protein [Lachnospiraceae bacterium]|nr:DUF1292 domain-containing protein [Lachnospiraceae bacterium]